MNTENKIQHDNSNWKRETKTNRRRGKGKIEKADTYSFFGIMLKKEGDLKDHIKKTESKANKIIREINEISSKQKVGQEEIWVIIKLF